MNIDLPLAILFVVSVTFTITTFLIKFNRRLDEREDARRRNQAHPWRFE